MKDGVTGAQHGLIAAEDLPGAADPRFEAGPIHLDAPGIIHTILVGNQKLPSGGNVVSLASVCLCDGRRHVIRKADVEHDAGGDPPVILHVRTVDFPAAPADRTLIRLVVNGQTRDPEQEIGL